MWLRNGCLQSIKYKPRKKKKINSKFNNNTNYIYNEHCNSVIKWVKSGVIYHKDNKFNHPGSSSSVNKTIKWEKHQGFYKLIVNGSVHLRNISFVRFDSID